MNSDSKWSSRKLFVALAAFIGASILVWFGKIDPAAWSLAFTGTVGAYLISQAYVDRGNGS